MANSKHIGKVISFLRRNYPQSDYDDVKYLGIEGLSSNYILYYEKVQRYGMCYYCAYSEECAEYGDQCDRLPSSDKYNDYIIEVKNGVVSEIWDGNREIRSRFRNDNLIWYGCEQRWISKQELEDIRYEEEEERKKLEEHVRELEEEYNRQLSETKCIIIDVRDLIKDYDIKKNGVIESVLDLNVIKQIEQFPISDLIIIIDDLLGSLSKVQSFAIYTDILKELDSRLFFSKFSNDKRYNVSVYSITKEFLDYLIQNTISFIGNTKIQYLVCIAVSKNIINDVINKYNNNELLICHTPSVNSHRIRYEIRRKTKISEYVLSPYLELGNETTK